MIVTSVLIPQFGPEESKVLIAALGDLHAQLRSLGPPGLIQVMLLREDEGQAQLLTFWERRSDMLAFAESELGSRLRGQFGELPGADRFEFRDYFVTWEANEHPRPAVGSRLAANARGDRDG